FHISITPVLLIARLKKKHANKIRLLAFFAGNIGCTSANSKLATMVIMSKISWRLNIGVTMDIDRAKTAYASPMRAFPAHTLSLSFYTNQYLYGFRTTSSHVLAVNRTIKTWRHKSGKSYAIYQPARKEITGCVDFFLFFPDSGAVHEYIHTRLDTGLHDTTTRHPALSPLRYLVYRLKRRG